MAARVRLTVVGFGVAFLLGLTAWLVAGAPGAAQSETEDSNGFAGAIRPADQPSTAFTGLHDERGRPITRTGDVTIVTFLYTQCQDTCPTTAQQIRGALDRLKVAPQVIAISVDPRNDDERSAREFLAEQSLLGRMTYALGGAAALRRQWDTYAIAPQTAEGEHTAAVVLLDRHGLQRVGFPAGKLTPEGLADDVQRLRAEA